MMMGSWRLQTRAKVLFSRGPLELSLTFRCAKWVRALKPKDSCPTFCARTHSRHAIPLWPFKGSILCRSLIELYLLTESFVYEKTPNHNTKKNRSLGEGTTLTLHTPPLMFGCFLQFLWCEYSSVFFSISWIKSLGHYIFRDTRKHSLFAYFHLAPRISRLANSKSRIQ